jgi:Spy/CpxP family protein refolding chaperone
MKMRFSRFVPRWIWILAVLMPAAVQGQTQTNRTPRAAEAARERRFAGPVGPNRPGTGFERLMAVLTDEQRRSLREAMEAQREKMRPLEEKLQAARREVFELGLAKNFDEETVRNKAMAAAKLDAELTVLRTKALSEMRPPLSIEQLARLRGGPDETGEIRGERPRVPEQQRDENGLPPKK